MTACRVAGCWAAGMLYPMLELGLLLLLAATHEELQHYTSRYSRGQLGGKKGHA